jgi:hypothetical protein
MLQKWGKNVLSANPFLLVELPSVQLPPEWHTLPIDDFARLVPEQKPLIL